LNRTHPWRSFHAAWAAAMARLLNQSVLPSGYYALPIALELAAVDSTEVRVLAEDGPGLRAAIERVSPRSADRLQTQQAFAVKCVGYLQQGSSVVVVDTVTTRRADLHAAILALMGLEAGAASPGLSAVSYRTVGQEDETQQLQLWPAPLNLGAPLPTLPLWIAADFSVPLDLEASYQAACTDLLIRHAG
jgi:hypothetical protein